MLIDEQGCVIFRGLQVANVKSLFINSNHYSSYWENLKHNLLTFILFYCQMYKTNRLQEKQKSEY